MIKNNNTHIISDIFLIVIDDKFEYYMYMNFFRYKKAVFDLSSVYRM